MLVERGNIFIRPSAKAEEIFEHTVSPSALAKKCQNKARNIYF